MGIRRRVPGATLLAYTTMPDPTDGPGMFAQSDPDVVATTLAAAGYDTIEVRPVEITLTLGADPTKATEYLAETGPGRAVLDTIPEPDRPAALDAIHAVLVQHLTPHGVELGAAVWITTADRTT